MAEHQTSDWVITTNPARCRDCYRCVRTCHVKAIRVQNGQAQIVPSLCIACGHCVLACPQGAKVVRDDRPEVRRAIAEGRKVIASVAPSAPAYFGFQLFSQIEQALLGLGFTGAGETAYGAEMVGKAHKELVDQQRELWPIITSSCPVVVNLIEKYYPDLLPHLAPIVSPMIAHGRALRADYGDDAFLVFIGPCIAKKEEIQDQAVEGVFDAALSFGELRDWLQNQGVAVDVSEQPLERVPRSDARAFPVEGGLIGTANLDTDMLASHIVTTSGLEACEDVLRGIRAGELASCAVELMACEGGCINGPEMEETNSTYLARQRVLAYAARRQPQPMPERAQWPDLGREYHDRRTEVPAYSEEQIKSVLRLVDKHTPDDELNCGACGYPTCRDKAVATLRGMAEATMCIPYMRRRAESLRQVVMDVTPNGVLIVDNRLLIQDLSPSAEKMLDCTRDECVGKPLSKIVAMTDGVAHVRATGEPVAGEKLKLREDLVVEETVVPVKNQNLMVVILRDITEQEQQRGDLERIRTETLARTQDVVNRQMRVAHEIAQLLGETTAESKMMLSRLASLLKEGEGQ
ncbi:MAG: 4Fe-4S binding protein [Chloroflexi bacterium]|nr:4Fe-4S binding protein [Chloroflexota bacterium]